MSHSPFSMSMLKTSNDEQNKRHVLSRSEWRMENGEWAKSNMHSLFSIYHAKTCHIILRMENGERANDVRNVATFFARFF